LVLEFARFATAAGSRSSQLSTNVVRLQREACPAALSSLAIPQPGTIPANQYASPTATSKNRLPGKQVSASDLAAKGEVVKQTAAHGVAM
jgi:hypothetical protein